MPGFFQTTPNVHEAYAYEASMILTQAVTSVGSDPAAIRDYLMSTTFKSLTGPLRFDKFGEVDRDFEVVQVRAGEFVRVKF